MPLGRQKRSNVDPEDEDEFNVDNPGIPNDITQFCESGSESERENDQYNRTSNNKATPNTAPSTSNTNKEGNEANGNTKIDKTAGKRSAFDVLIQAEKFSKRSKTNTPNTKESSSASNPTTQTEDPDDGTAQQENDFPKSWQFLKNYFAYVSCHKTKKGFSYIGSCLKCKKKISSDKSSSANFKRHYSVTHDEELIVANNSDLQNNLQRISRKERQMKLNESLEPISNQKQLDNAVAKAVYHGYHPFSMVEEKFFIQLIQKCLKSNISGQEMYVPCRKKIVKCMEIDYQALENTLISTLARVDFAAVTADVWKSTHEAFIGMTVHWIQDDLTRKSAVLALKRMEFQITYYEIGVAINEILQKYGINEKTVMVTTDNGSNFIKSFRVYGEETNHDQITNEQDDDEYNYIEVYPMMNEDTIHLPNHHRCASHTMNLIMQTDAEKFDDTTTSNYKSEKGDLITERIAGKYIEAKIRAFKLCRTIWTSQNKATKNADLVKKILGKYLPVPNDTRWNSFFVAVKEIANEKNRSKITRIGQTFSIFFEEQDFRFLQEYCSVMEEFATALDILQGENKIYFGILLPTIYCLRRNLEKLITSNLVYCGGLLNHLLTSLNKRFENYWLKEEYLIASALLPPFKQLSNWIRNEETEEIVRNAVTNITSACQNHKHITEKNTSGGGGKMRNFFGFDEVDECNAVVDCGYDKFVSDKNSLSILEKYPCLKKFFCQYNTALPSSAAVERIFSVAGDILAKKRCNLNDEHFEQRLKLKIGIK